MDADPVPEPGPIPPAASCVLPEAPVEPEREAAEGNVHPAPPVPPLEPIPVLLNDADRA